LISTDDSLRIVPQKLWDRVQKRLVDVEKTWPAKKGQQGFQTQTASWVAEYPAELLSGGMVCGVCGAGISKVSGKSGGYYGCFGAVRGKCENRLLVRRTLAERIILAAVRDALVSAENIAYVFKRVQQEVLKASADSPELIRLKAAELDAEDRRIANFVEFVAEGRGSRMLAEALLASERKRDESEGRSGAATESPRGRPECPPAHLDRGACLDPPGGSGEAYGAVGASSPGSSREDPPRAGRARKGSSVLPGGLEASDACSL
jgi:hypothetical protein